MAEIFKIRIDPTQTATEQLKPIFTALRPKGCPKHPDVLLNVRIDASIHRALECWEDYHGGRQRHEWHFSSEYELCQECADCSFFKLPDGCARFSVQSKTIRMEPNVRAASDFQEWQAQLESPVCRRTDIARTLPYIKATIHPSVPEYVVTPVFESCPACTLEWVGVPPSLSRSNFECFSIETEIQREVVESCRAFAHNPTGFLLLLGSVGTGKTHLSIAALGTALAAGHSGRFLKFSELLALQRASYRGDEGAEMAQKINNIRNVKVLVLDEVRLNGGRDEEPLLFDLVSYRLGEYLPTVLTTNLMPDQIESGLGSRTVDRIREGLFAFLGFGWESHRSKVNGTYLARASLLCGNFPG